MNAIKRMTGALLGGCLAVSLAAMGPTASAAGMSRPVLRGDGSYSSGSTGTSTPAYTPTYTPTYTPAYTTGSITWTNAARGMTLNGRQLSSMPLMNVNGVPYCSVKVFFENALASASVVWANNGARVTGTTAGGEQLVLAAQPGSQYMQVNGQSVYVPNGVKILDGLTMAPIEQLAGVFQGSSVSYDWTLNVYVVNTGTYLSSAAYQQPVSNGAAAGGYQSSGVYDAQALDLIARIINAEAGTLPLEGKVAVGNVIMNRVASSEFPNTVYGVIYQPNQFTVINHASFQRTPSEESIQAAKMVLDGVNYVPGAVFYNVSGLNSWASRNRPYLTTFMGHDFYL